MSSQRGCEPCAARKGSAESTLTVGEVALELRQRVVTYRGELAGIDLARVRGGRAADAQGGLPRDAHSEIEEELYGFEDDIASNAIEVHIHNLRRKLGPHFITNVKGRGYRVDNTR